MLISTRFVCFIQKETGVTFIHTSIVTFTTSIIIVKIWISFSIGDINVICMVGYISSKFY
jgi:hypothetical protein